jgi:hypothetical protein
MRAILGAIAVAAVLSFAGASAALATPTKTTASAAASTPAKMTVLAQRCRCVERRWNGSCKLRVCRDHW